ncbi:unnamed protein product [Brassica rapa subsp. narinosa]|uniref:Uncharacterized protein n=1 Tax=Brassica campestris TaxID=3711 RepID=M4DT00_BRACM|nr:unnamed protein product [Brassica rapa]
MLLASPPEKNCPERMREEKALFLIATIQPNLHKELHGGYQSNKYLASGNATHHSFQKRVDRHRNAFGDRVSTRQTHNPPPARSDDQVENSKLSWRSKPTQEKPHMYASPPYIKNRDPTSRSYQRSRDLFPRRNEGQWRPKHIRETEATSLKEPAQVESTSDNANQLALVQARPNGPQSLSKEAVMEELHEVTRQYPNCPDRVEAAARCQRVHFSDANDLMEQTKAAILAAKAANQPFIPLQIRASDSNPVTPPPSNDYPLRAWLFRDPSILISPKSKEEKEDDGLESMFSNDPLFVAPKETLQERVGPARIRSIVVSHTLEKEGTSQGPQTQVDLPEEEETLLTFQNMIKAKPKKPTKKKSPQVSPNIVYGASSKKRNSHRFKTYHEDV